MSIRVVKEDEEKYEKMMPMMGEKPDVAKFKVRELAKVLARDVMTNVEALGRAGYDISPFDDTVNAMNFYLVGEAKKQAEADPLGIGTQADPLGIL